MHNAIPVLQRYVFWRHTPYSSASLFFHSLAPTRNPPRSYRVSRHPRARPRTSSNLQIICSASVLVNRPLNSKVRLSTHLLATLLILSLGIFIHYCPVKSLKDRLPSKSIISNTDIAPQTPVRNGFQSLQAKRTSSKPTLHDPMRRQRPR